MKKVIEVKALEIKTVIYGLIMVSFACILAITIAFKIKNPTNQTLYIIFSLGFILMLAGIILNSKIKSVTLFFGEHSLRITEKNLAKEIIISDVEILYPKIQKYYLCNSFIVSKFGYLFSLKTVKNYSYCVNYDITKQKQIDKTNLNELKHILKNELNITEKRGFWDNLILFFLISLWTICFSGIIAFFVILFLFVNK